MQYRCVSAAIGTTNTIGTTTTTTNSRGAAALDESARGTASTVAANSTKE